MPITPEQALSLTDSEVKVINEVQAKIDSTLNQSYDPEESEAVPIEIPSMRHVARYQIMKNYEQLGWRVDDLGNDCLEFSSDISVASLRGNRPTGHPYR
jgi:hypothetical protein